MLKRYTAKDLYNVLAIPLSIALAAFVSMLLFSVSITRQTEESTFSTLMESAQQQVTLFNVSIEGQIKMLETLADSIGASFDSAGDLRAFIPRMEMMKYSSNFTTVGVVGKDGAGYTASGSCVNIKDREYFQKSMLHQTVVEKVDSAIFSKRPRFIFSVPIISENRVVGVLFGSYDFPRFREVAKVDAFKGSSCCFIVDGGGDVVVDAHRNCYLFGGEDEEGKGYSRNFLLDVIKKSKIDKRYSFAAFMDNFKTEKCGMLGFSFKGHRRYAVYCPLEVNDWTLFNLIDASLVDARKNRILCAAFDVVVIVSLCSLLLLLCIYRLNASKNRELLIEHERLCQSEALHRIAANFSDAVLLIADAAEGTLTYNKNFKEKFGYEPRFHKFADLMEKMPLLAADEDEAEVRKFIDNLNTQEGEQSLECRVKTPDGGLLWMRFEYVKIFDSGGRLQRIVARITNIDEEKRSLLRLQNQADSDPLTGLLNRKAATARIEEFLAADGRLGTHALFVIDIDNFKEINDRFGHMGGDLALTALAEEMRNFFRSSDIISRLGGDEFIVMLKNIRSAEAALSKAGAFCEYVRGIKTLDKQKYSLSVSVGVAVAAEGDKDFERLYTEADKALYRVKAGGKNGCALF